MEEKGDKPCPLTSKDCLHMPSIANFDEFVKISEALDSAITNFELVDTFENLPTLTSNEDSQFCSELGQKYGLDLINSRFNVIQNYVKQRKQQRDIENKIKQQFTDNKQQFVDLINSIIKEKTSEDIKKFDEGDSWIDYKKEMIEMLYSDVGMNCGKLNYVFNMKKYYELCVEQVNREIDSLGGEGNINTRRAVKLLNSQHEELTADPMLSSGKVSIEDALEPKTFGQEYLSEAMKKDRTDMLKIDGYIKLRDLFLSRIEEFSKYANDENANWVFENCDKKVTSTTTSERSESRASTSAVSEKTDLEASEIFFHELIGSITGGEEGMRGGAVSNIDLIEKQFQKNADAYIFYTKFMLSMNLLYFYYLDKESPDRSKNIAKYSLELLDLFKTPKKGGNRIIKRSLRRSFNSKKNKTIKRNKKIQVGGDEQMDIKTDDWLFVSSNNRFNLIFVTGNNKVSFISLNNVSNEHFNELIRNLNGDIPFKLSKDKYTLIYEKTQIRLTQDITLERPKNYLNIMRLYKFLNCEYNKQAISNSLFTNLAFLKERISRRQLTQIETLNFVNINKNITVTQKPIGQFRFTYLVSDQIIQDALIKETFKYANDNGSPKTMDQLYNINFPSGNTDDACAKLNYVFVNNEIIKESQLSTLSLKSQGLDQQITSLVSKIGSGETPDNDVLKVQRQINQQLQANQEKIKTIQREACQRYYKACEEQFNTAKEKKCISLIEKINSQLEELERKVTENKDGVNLSDFNCFKKRDTYEITPTTIKDCPGTEGGKLVYERFCQEIPFMKNLILFIDECDKLNAVKKWRNDISKLLLGFMKRIVYGKEIGEMTGITLDKPGYNIFNLVLMGTPGVGKSYNAGIIGKALYYSGLLAKGKLQVITSTDLIAGYIGQTKGQVAEKLAGALGDVFFLDEAYAIAGKPGPGKTFDKYGQEALDEITDFSSKNIGLLSFIVAGYEYEMQTQFLDVNPGLPRRFPTQILLTRNSIMGLWFITLSQMKKNFIGQLYSPDNLKYHEACFQYLNLLFNYQVAPNPTIKGSSELATLWNLGIEGTAPIFKTFIRFGNLNENTQKIVATGTTIPFMEVNDNIGTYVFPLKPEGGSKFKKVTEQFLQSFIVYKTGIQNDKRFPPNGDFFRSQSDTMIKMAGMILNDFQTGKGLELSQNSETTQEQWKEYIRYLYFELFFKKNPAFPIKIDNINVTFENKGGNDNVEFFIQSAYPNIEIMKNDILETGYNVALEGMNRPPGTGSRGTDSWWFFSNDDFKNIVEDLQPLIKRELPRASEAEREAQPQGAAKTESGAKTGPETGGSKGRQKNFTKTKKNKRVYKKRRSRKKGRVNK